MALCCLALTLALAIGPAARAQSCGPSQLGNPCARGDVASQGGLAPEADLGIGNPVHLVTGNKYLFEEDLPALPASPLLTVARHYNSLDPRHGPLGRGWTLNYDTRLHTAGKGIQIMQADGSRVDFPLPGPQSHVQTPRGQLHRHASGWAWHWPNGQRLSFDAEGRLVAVHAALPRPGLLRIQRHGAGLLHGLIATLRDEHGHEVRFRYRLAARQAYLDGLDTPLGHWRYHYDSARAGQGLRLVAVEGPDGAQRRYPYEAERQGGNPWLPTGIVLARDSGTGTGSDTGSGTGVGVGAAAVAGVGAAAGAGLGTDSINGANSTNTDAIRLRTWHYDAQGRVIQAWQAPALAQAWQLRLAYGANPKPGRDSQTQLHTAGGRRLTLHTRNVQGRYTLPAATLSLAQGTFDEPEGWPGLLMRYDAAGRRTHWHSPLTGAQTLRYDALGRLARTESAGGAQWQYNYDSQHRLLRMNASRGSGSLHIQLHWRQDRLARVEHPAEREQLAHDSQGRIVQRDISRPALPGAGQQALNYRERFEYDARGRLTAHHLPEGGSLRYQWSAAGRVLRLAWHDRQGRRHIVLQGIAGQPGYRHGNGLHTHTRLHGGRTLAMAVMNGTEPLWMHLRRQDAQGRVTHLADWHGWRRTGQGWRLYHDQALRLARAVPVILPPVAPPVAKPALPPREAAAILASRPTTRAPLHEEWYAWHADGGLAARRHQGDTRKPDIERSADGLPRRIDDKRLHYGPSGRLERVVDGQGRTARYTHNAHGYRINAWHAMPDSTYGKQYLYVGHRLAAETDTHLASGLVSRRYLYAGQALVGFIDHGPGAPDGALYAVHTDPLGTPRLVTDARRRVRWLADYSPTGELRHQWGDLELDMRLPGQVADPLTGWHDNLLRTYAPAMGAYLEPDPLGPMPGQQALGYARQQPQRYTDPTGLILFAFDGTRLNILTKANVRKMNQRYGDGAAFYQAGPGNPYYMNHDALVGLWGPLIVARQWQLLLDSLQVLPAHATHAIDIIGFSRGAALARHFGNMIASHTQDGLFRYNIPGQGLLQACVDLRFMGLFDTVAQFGLHGALNQLYDFSISPQWTRVAHAVALHEYRSWFPLTSTMGTESANVIEMPFLGAHADIGGGVNIAKDAPPPGDLADVALNWMLEQGRLAGVRWRAGPLSDNEITHPVLHDDRPATLRWLYDGDRRVDDAFDNQIAWRQGDLDNIGAPQRDATEAFIRRFDDWRTRDGADVGEVDMAGYAQWLQETLGWRPP